MINCDLCTGAIEWSACVWLFCACSFWYEIMCCGSRICGLGVWGRCQRAERSHSRAHVFKVVIGHRNDIWLLINTPQNNADYNPQLKKKLLFFVFSQKCVHCYTQLLLSLDVCVIFALPPCFIRCCSHSRLWFVCAAVFNQFEQQRNNLSSFNSVSLCVCVFE